MADESDKPPAYQPAKNHCLHIPSGAVGNHLFFIITDKCSGGKFLLVNISSIKSGVYHDPTCLVSPGEHPSVTTDSYVEYRFARIEDATHLTKCVGGWVFRKGAGASDQLIEKIRLGVMKSKFTPQFIKLYFSQNS